MESHQSMEAAKKQQQLFQLLQSWNLPVLMDHFIKEGIYVEQLRRVQPHQIPRLMAYFPLGVYIDFEYMLMRWQSDQGSVSLPEPVSPVPTPASPSDTYGSTAPMNGNSVNLNYILEKSPQGRVLLKFARRDQALNSANRQILIESIIDHYVSNGLPMSPTTLNAVAKEIIRMFPQECEEYYYIKSSGHNPQGRLYSKYYNSRAKMKKCGLAVSKRSNAECTVVRNAVEDSSSSASSNTTDQRSSSSESTDDKESVRLEISENPSLLAQQHCRYSTQERLMIIKASSSVLEVLEACPEYKEATGYKLIDSDFQAEHNDPKKIFEIDEFMHKFLLSPVNEVKDQKCQRLINTLSSSHNMSENGKYCSLLHSIHGFLIPTMKSVKNFGNGGKTTVRFSIRDSQNSFIYCISSLAQVQEQLEYLRSIGESEKPFVIAVGEIVDPREIYVYFNGVTYTMFSVVAAVDICFKIFHVFDLNYTEPCLSVWQFIQHYFYDMKTAKDKAMMRNQLLLSMLGKKF